MTNPFDAAILALYQDDKGRKEPKNTSAIRVLEAAGQAPDRWAIEVAFTNPTIELWQINILLALLDALPEKETP